ncbi:MAG TPA: MBL fold metallo-hydrolase [Pyrinomonadaceae bacterium]|nr:MBL fold metallo-hydrolase [Pyrinomonadaceae bacterium]
MRVEYICHACLFIDTGDVRIVTDPWFDGPTYCGQWNVFPKPVNTGVLDSADVILLSHGHEDHLHEPTMKRLPKGAKVFYPYNWYGGTKEYIEGMGFRDVSEAVTYKTYRLTDRTSVTYLANNLDSIIVIDSDGEILVDINDALHSMPTQVIDFYIRELRSRWPRIDMLFCGFGGASYFPNSIHVEGKNDEEIGALREQLFAHNFCRIVAGLAPQVAVPFAADFALLSPEQRWINEARFPRTQLEGYFHKHFGGDGPPEPSIRDMYPGDVLEGGRFHADSPYRRRMKQGSLNHLIDEQYKEEIERLQIPHFIPEQEAERLVEEIRANVEDRAALFDAATLDGLRFAIGLSDVERDGFYNVAFTGGRPSVRRTARADANCSLLLNTSSRILRYSFGSEWGGDAITIGYGCEIYASDKSVIEAKLDTVCVRLLTRHPTAKGHMRKEPIRGVKHIARNPLLRTWLMKKLRPDHAEHLNYDPSVWLLRTKCDVCQICDLPLLDAEFASQI